MEPDVFSDDLVAGGVRMDGVSLIKFTQAAHALEKKGDEGPVLIAGEFGEEALIAGGVVAHVGGHFHPREHDTDGGVFELHLGDDGEEVAAYEIERQAAQPVVGAEGEDKDVHRLPQDPVHATEAARRGVPGESGIDDQPRRLRGGGKGVEFLLQQGRVGLGGGINETIAGGKAIAQNEEGAGRFRLRPGE